MGIKRIYLWFVLGLIGFLLIFEAFIPQYSGVMAQAYESGSQGGRRNSSPANSVETNGMETNSMEINNVEIKPASVAENLTLKAGEAGRKLELTVYEQGIALVKERREINLKKGVNKVEYSGIASEIDPSSAIIEDLKNRDTVILEQNYEYDLANSSSLLDKYLGKEIIVTGRDGQTYNGTLLNYEGNNIVLKPGAEKILLIEEISKIELTNSSDLSIGPALIWQIYSPAAEAREFLISYLTSGIGWKADYVLISNDNETEADFRGWVNINNGAGITYENASLKLVSGEINRVSSPPQPLLENAKESVAEETRPGAPFSEKALSEYHLYALERSTTLKNDQEKQISLFSVNSVPIEKELVYDSVRGEKVWIMLTLENSNETGLGKPLPAGIVRVYKTDYTGELQFLGEDRIEHTPQDKELKIAIGSAFDLTVTRNQTDYQRVSDNVERVSYEIEINNSKSETQNVTVVEHLYDDWKILESSDPYEKKDAFTIEFKVAIPANSMKTISYTAERRF